MAKAKFAFARPIQKIQCYTPEEVIASISSYGFISLSFCAKNQELQEHMTTQTLKELFFFQVSQIGITEVAEEQVVT